MTLPVSDVINVSTSMATINSKASISPDGGDGAIVVGVSLHQIIKQMFANGEQGFTRTPDDLSTMYQDSAGTTPVTAVGQPVGLVLDKSKGLDLSSELLTALSPLNSTLSSTLPPLTATSTAASGAYGATKVNFAQAGKTYKVKMSWSGNAQL